MEPPEPVVPRCPGPVPHDATLIPPLTLAASAAATAAVVLSTGDVFAVALVLAVVARRAMAALTTFLVAGAVLVRWGSSSLGALAGAQAVFGPALAVGTVPEAAGAAVAGAAVLLAAPAAGAGRPSAAAMGSVPFGVLAAAVACGPSYAGAPALRVGATLLAVALTVAATRLVPASVRHPAAVAGGAAALVMAAVGQ